jgi:energy-coupling factor transporter ATP-binding protein EcfA2
MALMALEEDIVRWSKDRPAWQREVMRRTAAGALLSEGDYDHLVDEMLKSPDAFPEAAFGLEHLPKVTAENPPVRITSIAKPEHVNALASDQPLTFELKGLTIVYGDNGSGKSGYARLLKRITRARHQEEVLSDVFRDTTLEKPTASLSVRIGDRDQSLSWPDSTPPELKCMLFYDGACGSAYIATESDFPYRPSALSVMDGLISACVAIRSRLEAKLAENARSSAIIPVVPDELKNTDGGRLLNQLSASTLVATLDALIARFDASSETIDELRNEEARLRSADTSKERQRLTRQAEKLDALHKHVEHIHSMLGNDGLTALQERRDQLKALQDAADLLARSFESEPLPGVGTSPWKVLWESARRFSEDQAYSGQAFPVLEDNSRCVLCQETLGAEGRDRLSRFERFVKDDTQVRVDAARRLYDRQVESLNNLRIAPDAVVSDEKDLDATHAKLISEIRALLDKYQDARNTTLDAIPGAGPVALFGIEPLTTLTALTQAATTARDMATGLANPAIVQGRLAVTTVKRQELELMQAIKNSREGIIKEIARLKEREALEAAKTAAATGPITKKVLELSEESITEVVRDTFTRETDRLRLERVTIARTRADKGALLHQPKLVGARQDVKLPRVFSEGERTALGLAAFFTEAQLDGTKSSLVLDDPVTSLDHIRRGLVAARLAELAESRQVIMFTHDVSFVADLKREANGKGVLVAERSVTRSRADERKPGACSTKHPWKAKDVPSRLDELRQELNGIRRDSVTWDEKAYEAAVAVWAGNLSETWERIFSQEIVGPVLAEGGLEVRPMMVKVLARFSDDDHRDFEASYSRVSQWAKRHDKSALVNFVAPDVAALEAEFDLVDAWFKRVKGYKA